MDAQELLDKLKAAINRQLDQCEEDDSGTFTPKVCSFIAEPGGRDKVVQVVINYVAQEGMTIAEAIDHIERDFNNNLMEH